MKDINWQLKWQKKTFFKASQMYIKLGLKLILNKKNFFKLKFKKKVKKWLITAKLGYGHFNIYHKKFWYKKTDTDYIYGQKRAQLYFFSHSKAKKYRLYP